MIMLRSIAARSSWRSPVIAVKQASETDILSDVLSEKPHQSLQPRFAALSSRAIFMFRWIRLSFIYKTHALNTLFSACHVKKLACIYEPQFGWSSLNISLSDSVFSRWLLSTFWSVHLSNCHERQTFLNSVPNLISLLLAMKRRKRKIWLVVKKGAKYLPSTRFISQKFLKKRGRTCLDLQTENSSCHPESYFKAKNWTRPRDCLQLSTNLVTSEA